MPIDQQQKAIYESKIKQMKEDGFFLPAQRSLAGNDRYLIISYGGTGADALFGVKKALETALPKKEMDERIRLLAIDTDKNTQKQTEEIINADGIREVKEIDALEPAQFFHLSGDAARALFDTELEANVKEWLNPQMETDIRNTPAWLDGNGASGYRQLGRLTLYPGNTHQALAGRIAALARDLTNNNVAPLRIFILTGIAGGTGSGTVVDLTYLIRNVINTLPAIPQTRTKYCGFVLLPPTGKSQDQNEIDHGNRNGYAALKEINHFMTLSEREDTYSFVYGDGHRVTSTRNLFDVCYLTDGVSDMAYSNPRKQAVKVISESILDMISSSLSAASGAEGVQAVDSFMSDTFAFRTQMITTNSYLRAVRDADYLYCALGYSEFAIPSNQIKAYVGHRLFSKIYTLFKNCGNVEEEDAMEFVKAVIRRGIGNASALVASMEAELDVIFRDYLGYRGPFYAINLLKLVSTATNELRNKIRIMRPGQISNEKLDEIDSVAVRFNNEIFEAYTLAMDGLKELMEGQYGQVVEAGVHGNTYSFMPHSMAANAGMAAHIISYLEGLINETTLNGLTEALLEEMVNNRENWIALTKSDTTGTANAPAAMRKFWNTNLDKIVDSTLEDFLIKYYSADPNAHYSIENHAATQPYLVTAANAIYDSMLGAGGAAQPMAHLTPTGLDARSFNGHTYLMVPKKAPHLLEELRNVARNRAAQGVDVKVFESLSTDRISCYKRYSSIPAFKLDWTKKAEIAYEQALGTLAGVGSHMSETAGGKQWKNFPNLLPMSCWPLISSDYRAPREERQAQKAQRLFDTILEMGLAEGRLAAAGTENRTYTARILPAQYRPAEVLYKELDRCIAGSDLERRKLAAIDAAAENFAAQLFAKAESWESADGIVNVLEEKNVAFENRTLAITGMVVTVAEGDHAPENWDEYMAGCILRKMPETMYEVEGTILVMEKLQAMVEKSVRAKLLIKRFAQYLVAGVFTYNEDMMQWEYTDGEGMTKELVYVDTVEKAAEYYFMFNAFREDPIAVADAVAEKFAEKIPSSADRASRVTRQREFRDGGRLLKEEVATWIRTRPMRPYEGLARSMGYDLNAIQNFYQALYIEARNIEMAGYIPVDINPQQEEPELPDIGNGPILF